MKKIRYLLGVICLCFIFCGLIKAVPVQAAAYKQINTTVSNVSERKVGDVTFSSNYSGGKYAIKATKNGKTSTLMNVKGLSPVIVTNGSIVFCSVTPGYYSKATVYKIAVNSKAKTKLFTTSKKYGCFECCGYYNGKLFYVKDLDPGTFGSFQLSTKKHKTLATNVTTANQKGQYFYLTPYEGAIGPSKLRVYNGSNNKIVSISSKMFQYYVGSSKVYYIEFNKISYSPPFKLSVKCCNLNGSGKTTKVSSFTANSVLKLTSTYVKYRNTSGKTITKKY